MLGGLLVRHCPTAGARDRSEADQGGSYDGLQARNCPGQGQPLRFGDRK